MTDGLRQNTLYVMTQGAYLRRDHLTLQVEVERATKLAVPIHHVQSVAVFGNVMVSPGAMELCAETGAAVSFLTESGRLIARVDAPGSGNVLLRREQFRRADDAGFSARISRFVVVGKLQNCRVLMQRGARETDAANVREELALAIRDLEYAIRQLANELDLETVRGHEGNAARSYFAHLGAMIRQQRDEFRINGRSRRPPLDRVNALLSFVYALVYHDCIGALAAAGLDPSVGFLHADRPGRASLALDLMEEFRPLLADRLVLALINRQQVTADGLVVRDGGAVEMTDKTRRNVVGAYQQRKQEKVQHPVLEQEIRIGDLPFVQARLMARFIRGEETVYPPCVLR